MSSLLTSDIFFFITALSVIILTIIFATAGIYLVKILKEFKEMLEKLKNMVHKTEAEFDTLYAELTESWIFKLLFGRKGTIKKKVTK